ncbi:ABC transporter permease [Jiangella endophytica]|uniref:ABC transporter permease n=1 Tax=Jiangella endophytica TaxID=1623398 RepID=UPI000E3470B8|nr:ABC transporter permease [Jiangella endophytica]
MARYVLARLTQAAFVLWAAYTVSFVVLFALPGDPVALMVGPDANVTEEQMAAIRSQYGLDRPLAVQYLAGLAEATRGDLGDSMQARQPVTTAIAESFGPTAKLAGAALVVGTAAGVLLALLAMLAPRPWQRTALLTLPPLGVAVPSFLLGLLLLHLLSFRWQLFPASGDDGWRSLVLPALTMAAPAAGVIAQVLAAGLRQAGREDYMVTARAKGNSRPRAYARHALRNAALPALTMTGLLVGGLLAGSVVVETVFARPGLGRLTTMAVSAQDLALVQGLVLVGAALFVLVNLAVDLLYPLLDPRVATAPRRRAGVRQITAL